jgi:hypothetical protein
MRLGVEYFEYEEYSESDCEFQDNENAFEC